MGDQDIEFIMEIVKLLKFPRTQECKIIIETRINDTQMFRSNVAWSGSMAHMYATVNENGNIKFNVTDGSYLNPILTNVNVTDFQSIGNNGFETRMEALSYINNIGVGYISGLS